MRPGLDLGSWVILKSATAGRWKEEGIQPSDLQRSLPTHPATASQPEGFSRDVTIWWMYHLSESQCRCFLNKTRCGLKPKPVRKGKARAAFLFLKDDIKCTNRWNSCVCSPFLSCPPKTLNCVCLHVTRWICTLKLKTSVLDNNLYFREKFGRRKKISFQDLYLIFLFLTFL